MGSKKPKQRVTDYFMSVHYGLCHGPIEKLKGLKVAEKLVPLNMFNASATTINFPDLFGGVRKEGGLKGRVALQMGTSDQLMDSVAAAKHGLTPTTMPGYRGLSTVYFSETPGADRAGFYWSSNQPYVPPVWFQLTRLDRSWLPYIAAIPTDSESAVLTGLNWQLPCTGPGGTYTCTCGSGTTESFVMTGNSDVTYTKSFRFRGVVELNNYSGGTQINTRVVKNPTGFGTANVNHYTLEISSPAAIYYLNDGTFDITDLTVIDFEMDIPIDGGATITLSSDTRDGGQVDNQNNRVAPDDDPLRPIAVSQPFDGQFLQFDLDLSEVDLDMNPAHMIRECLLNTEWGRGLPLSTIDDASFAAAAQTLFDERFGLSMLWINQTDVESFISEIIDHINATFYVNPKTGLWTLTLIRNDYDAATLPIFDETNSKVTSFKRRAATETTNEIVVSWTNPYNEETEVVTKQDLGAIVANNGNIVSASRNYYGVRRAGLADELAARDLAVVTAPLATIELLANRKAWDSVPGGVVKITSAEHGAVELICRVLKINHGKPGDSEISVSVSEDVFGYSRPRANVSPGTLSPPLVVEPTAPDSLEFLTANYYFVTALGGSLEYPDATTMFLVGSENAAVYGYDAYADAILPTGGTIEESIGTYNITGVSTLVDALPKAASSSGVLFSSVVAGTGPTVAGFVIIGDDGLPEGAHEICLLMSEAGGAWTLNRGVLDTVPVLWPAGTPVRFVAGDVVLADPIDRTALVSQDYSFKTRTVAGLLPVGVPASYTPTERYYAPARPANVSFNGQFFVNFLNILSDIDIAITWSNRNRVTEETVLMAWDDAGVTPEVGQTTAIAIFDPDTGSEVNRISGLTGESYSLPTSELMGLFVSDVKVIAVRDGYDSIQGATVRCFRQDLLYFEDLTDNDAHATSEGDARATED